TQADEDLERLLGGRLEHDDGREPALQRGVLLYVAVVLAGRGRAYDLDLAAGERRLEDVRGVKGAFGAARSDQRVQLVDERDDPGTTQLLDDLTQALLELAAVLRAGDDVGEVDGEDAHAAQVGGDATLDDRLGEALDDGRLAYAWLAYEHGVVLRAAAEDLDDAAYLFRPTDDGVELAVLRSLGEVARVLVQEGRVDRLGLVLGVSGREDAPPDGVDVPRQLLQDAVGDAVALSDDAEEYVLRSDDVGAEAARLTARELHDATGTGGDGGCFVAWQAIATTHHALDLSAEPIECPAELRQHLAGGTALAHQAEEEVLGSDHRVAQLAPLFAREVEDQPGSVVVAVQAILRAAGRDP